MPRIINNGLPKGVYLWKIEESVEQLTDMVQLSENERLRFAAIKQPGKVSEKLAVRVLLQNTAKCSSSIDYTHDGRPTIRGSEISISHAGGYVALYLSEKPVGIDLESVDRKAEKLRDRVVLGSEEEVCQSVFPTNPLILAWCVKESMFKAMQCREVDFVKEIVIEKAVSDRIFGHARGQKMEMRWLVIEDVMIVVARQCKG